MPGGPRAAYDRVEPILKKISAQVPDSGPCVTYIGPGGAGNYVKMIHNGIEYGDMQLIAESYDLLKNLAGLNNDQLSATFSEWNGGELQSYLIEITAQIFQKKDNDKEYLVDKVLDKTGNKVGYYCQCIVHCTLVQLPLHDMVAVVTCICSLVYL